MDSMAFKESIRGMGGTFSTIEAQKKGWFAKQSGKWLPRK
jgi:histone acetyltransferase (RNA polymerase elongator complex component)